METREYSKEHIWIKTSGNNARLGITEYAQKRIDKILFVNLMDEGEIIKAGESFGDIESMKTVTELISPVTGKVVNVNEDVIENPEDIKDLYQTWFIEIETDSKSGELMSETEYREYVDDI